MSHLLLIYRPIHSRLELWELQRFLWARLTVSLSDEAFDALTSRRRLCDTDGRLALPGIKPIHFIFIAG
jgi:hypothetical protein